MISSRRRAHLGIHLLLWPLAFAVFGASIEGRRPVPLVERWPAALLESPPPDGPPLWTREDLLAAWPARVVAYRDRTLVIQPLRPIDRPDLLIYWAQHVDGTDSLPADAHLLGRISGTTARAFRLPEDARPGDDPARPTGFLFVYSLGHQELVAAARLPEREDGRGDPSRPIAPDEQAGYAR